MKYNYVVFCLLIVLIIGSSTSGWWIRIIMVPNGVFVEQDVKRNTYQRDEWIVSTHVYVYENHKPSTLEYWTTILVKESLIDSVKNAEYIRATNVKNKIRL